MNRSNPSTVVGGGEMNRATSSVVSSAKSDGASDAPQLSQGHLISAQHRQTALPVSAGHLLGAGDLSDRRLERLQVEFQTVGHLFHD